MIAAYTPPRGDTVSHAQEFSPSSHAVPAPVAQIAVERRLGNFIDLRSWGDPRSHVLKGLAASAVALILMALVVYFVHFLYIFSVFFLLLLVWGITNAISALVRGRQENFLYEEGMVHRKRDDLIAVTWPEVSRLEKSKGNRSLTGGRRFRVNIQDGRSFAVPLVLTDGADPFITHLAQILRQHGRPVD